MIETKDEEQQTIAASGIVADEQLRRRIRIYLHNQGVPGLEEVDVEASSGTVVLRGRMPSGRAKQLCAACCRRVAGVIKLIDDLQVETRPRLSTTGPVTAASRR